MNTLPRMIPEHIGTLKYQIINCHLHAFAQLNQIVFLIQGFNTWLLSRSVSPNVIIKEHHREILGNTYDVSTNSAGA